MRRQALLTLVLLAALPCAASGQVRRAVVIGINHYTLFRPPGAGGSSSISASASSSGAAATLPNPGEQRPFVGDLKGARADAQAMAAILQSKYGFDSANVKLLLDGAATRAGILAAIENLIRDAQRGDVIAVYYAGHGAERYNSKSWKARHLDQTIVPVDANSGVFDIRDKELADLFNRLIDKGVSLTLIFDSCHSGSITRGDPTGLVRLASIDRRDSKDDSRPTPPEERGALVFSAAQDDELATEKPGPDGDHGVFTTALIRVLRATPNSEPAHQIYQRVKAIVQAESNVQEPVIKGTEANKRRPLFGVAMGDLGGRMTVALLRVEADTATIQGGVALGFGPGTELVQLDQGKSKTAAPVRLRVVKVTGMSSSRATVISGKAANVPAGTLFVIDKWSPPDRPVLRVFMPPAVTVAELDGLARSLGEMRTGAALEWVDDPSTLSDDGRPLFIVFPTKSGWKARSPLGTTASIAAPNAAAVSAAVASLATELSERAAQVSLAARSTANVAPRPRVFVVLPPSTQVRAAIHIGEGSANNAIALVESPDQANYILAGRLTGEGSSYAWLRPDATSSAQKHSSLPARSTWFTPAQAPDSLEDRVLRLGRVNGWLTIDSPPQDEFFPYQLVLRNVESGEAKDSGVTYGGDRYDLVLRRDTAQHPKLVSKRWIYVFALNSYGEAIPVYPQSGTVENRVPFDSVDVQSLLPAEIKLPRKSPVTIGAPYGMDTWILVTSDEAIDVETFRFEGVRTDRGAGGGGLAALLAGVGGGTRSPTKDASPTTWSVQRITLLSKAKPVAGSGQ